MVSDRSWRAVTPSHRIVSAVIDICGVVDWQLRCRTTAALPRLLFDDDDRSSSYALLFSSG